MLARFLEQPLAGCYVTATDEQSSTLEIIRHAREDRAVHQIAHLFRLHAAVAEHLVRPGVDRHDPIKNARLWIAVELDEDLALVHAESRIENRGWRIVEGKWRTANNVSNFASRS